MNNFKERINSLSLEQRALLNLMIKRKGLSAPDVNTLSRRKPHEPVPLSFAQQRLWFLDQLMPGNPMYNEPVVALRLKGALDIAALRRTLDEIVRRHEALRTTFPVVDGEPVQAIAPPAPLPLPLIDLRHLSPHEREAELHRIALEESQFLFNLATGPLMRVSLVQMDEQEYVVLLEMHHIITDGWSNRVLMREVSELYQAFSTGRPSPLPELPIQYADFTLWQRAWLQGETLERLIDYWRGRLGTNPPALKLPTDFPRPPVQSFNGATQLRALSCETSEALKELSRKEGVTLYMTLLAGFLTLLYRYSGQDDIVIGSPIANRSTSETERLIGFFVNTLVMRVDLSGNPRFRELLGRVKEVTTEAYIHQDIPFEKLVEVLQPERSLNRQSLFQVLFGLHNYPTQSLEIHGLELVNAPATGQASESSSSGLTMSDVEVENIVSKFDLALSMMDLGEKGLKAQLDYSTDLFAPQTITRMLTHFETLLQSVAAQPETRLNVLKVFAEANDEQAVMKKKEGEESFLKKLKGLRHEAVNLK